ncbi:Gp15 family bacteriophage protein [Lactococcus garvieae]|uniref:Gp15 family bacteriophage protein n=1 Tax=Lactococcus garvieae TaxID=1363 RepID=UPI000EC229DC|nr:Gp15 family bacteriophage protein [Lactococcus garvieae]HCS86693.1 hypothetical protein [Lactococcus garvieae]
MALSLSWGISNSIEVEGLEYELDLEFSKVLRFFEVWKDDDLSNIEKAYISISMLLADKDVKVDMELLPSLLTAIAKRIVGDKAKSDSVKRDLKGNILEEEKKYYDLEEDADYIYSSFIMDYGIDLIDEREKGTLHWDKFNALIIGLSDNTKFKRVIEIRQMEIPEKATLEEKEKIQKAKQEVALKSNREMIEFEMMDLKQKREYMMRKEETNGK